MSSKNASNNELQLRQRIAELEARLGEADETLRAIRDGEVDAVVVTGSRGEQIFSLVGTESIYRLIVETMKEAAFTVTFDGTILFANAQFAELLKRPMEQIVGRTLNDFVAQSQQEAASGMLAAAKRNPVRQRLVFEAADGTAVPAHVAANVLNQPDDLSICVVANDLTELENSTELIHQLRRQQEALRESEDRYRGVVQNTSAVILRISPQGIITFANERALKFFGYAAEELIGKHAVGTIIPERESTGRDLAKMVNEILTKPNSFHSNANENIRKDGSRVWMEWTNSGVYDEDGRLREALAVGIDATDRRQAEEALLRSQESLRAVLDSSQDVIYRLDVETGRFDYISPSCANVTGFSPEELMSLDSASSLEMVHPDDRAAMQAAIDRLGQAGSVQVEYRQRAKDGDYRWLSNHMSLACNIDDHHIYRNGSIRDVTEKKEAEEALRRLNAELEHRVTSRTADLTRTVESLHEEVTQRLVAEKQLRERTEQLQALAGELTLAEQRERVRLARVLHDGLQQLLVAAQFRLAVLGRSSDKSVRDAAATVGDLLLESIQTSRSLTAELSPPILQEGGLRAGLQWLGRWMKEKHDLLIEMEIAEAAEEAIEDDARVLLFQATRELLFNVVKHSGVKTARLVADRQDNWLHITVADSGSGFDPEAVKSGPSGAFGLFSIGERLSLLGGSVEVSSCPQAGTRVTLAAPVGDAAKRPIFRARPIKPPASDTKAARAGKIRIVLVDDHTVLRQGLMSLLQQEPDVLVVGEASDGQTGVELVRQIRPDVVLMDVSMPGMNGAEATRLIHSELPQVRVIGLSMFEESDWGNAMREAGAEAYISKHGPADELLAAIRGRPA